MSTSPLPPVHSLARLGVAAVVLAQCLGTALWFSPAGAAEGLMDRWQLQAGGFAWLLAATQLGFIAGTLLMALTGSADRWRASRIFAISCCLGALANAALVLPGVGFELAWVLRAVVGLSLAGIYPLGMKLVVQWVGGKPALALAWLVAMLTLGTAMPHVLRAVGLSWPWPYVLLGASVLAVAGALLVASVGDGPYRPAKGAALRVGPADWQALAANAPLRGAAAGYFGHMWELYAFWAVVPALSAHLLHSAQASGHPLAGSAWQVWLPAWVIGVGALGCLLGGYAVRWLGGARVAFVALAGSGAVCLVYPLVPEGAIGLRLLLLSLWGALVVADSPQFSALVSQAAPPQQLGLALALQNGIGFLISVISIVLLGALLPRWGDAALWLLLPGPLLGLLALWPLLRQAG